MRLTESHRRELLKALYSTERLAHLFKRTSYYSEEPSRTFLNALWESIETGSPPSASTVNDLKKFLQSDKIPDETGCVGADHMGQSYILALHMLLSFLSQGDVEDLEYIFNEIEGGIIDDLAIDELTKNSNKSTVLVTNELSEKANKLPIKINFMNQLAIDHRKAYEIDLQHNHIESSKDGSLDEISQRIRTSQ